MPELLEEGFDDTAGALGDIVLITDDGCRDTEERLRGWDAAKHRLGFRVFERPPGLLRSHRRGSSANTAPARGG
ncbi:hypothetical protein ACGF7W_08335 [Streptomyces sp. NPDC048219]|uniref:hypothetical protein n=1 Tax=Streptomyces sp. NPDC048219 TaxID=3365517 RepID=UPI003721ADCA